MVILETLGLGDKTHLRASHSNQVPQWGAAIFCIRTDSGKITAFMGYIFMIFVSFLLVIAHVGIYTTEKPQMRERLYKSESLLCCYF